MLSKKNVIHFGAIVAMAMVSDATIAQTPPQTPGQNPNQNQNQAGQGRGQGRRGGRISLATLPVATLDTALKLTADQKTKVTAIQEKYRTDSQALRPAQGAQPDPANAQKLRELTMKTNTEIEAILSKDQNEKFKEIVKELTGITRAGIPAALALELDLTADQKAKIEAIAKETQTKVQSGGDRRAAMEEARTKIDAILTAEQKAKRDKFMAERGNRTRRRPNP
jgi:protein CpxP